MRATNCSYECELGNPAWWELPSYSQILNCWSYQESCLQKREAVRGSQELSPNYTLMLKLDRGAIIVWRAAFREKKLSAPWMREWGGIYRWGRSPPLPINVEISQEYTGIPLRYFILTNKEPWWKGNFVNFPSRGILVLFWIWMAFS